MTLVSPAKNLIRSWNSASRVFGKRRSRAICYSSAFHIWSGSWEGKMDYGLSKGGSGDAAGPKLSLEGV